MRGKGTTCLFACESRLFMGWWERRGGTTWRQFGWSVLLGIDSQSLWKYRAALSLPFTIAFFYIKAEKKGQYRKWKATAVKFYSPFLSFLVHFMRCSLLHSILASVPQETIEDFVLIVLKAISFLNLFCGIFSLALEEEADSLCWFVIFSRTKNTLIFETSVKAK